MCSLLAFLKCFITLLRSFILVLDNMNKFFYSIRKGKKKFRYKCAVCLKYLD